MFPSTNNQDTKDAIIAQSGRALSLSLSLVCGFGAGQCVRKIVEREREREDEVVVVCLVALCIREENSFA